ncbi:transcriptional regulator, LysR family protein [gamma proteobacterium IMCC1989]|nr:transcriptional regulator, LysR family protein [gamma proteobacterium IMCC1989]
MDTQLLHAFVTVAEEQSFSIAAERLHITQSAISKRIALLEQQLAHTLFDRIARRVYLTESGQALLPRAKHILDSIEDTQHFMMQKSGAINGELRLATSHHIGIHRLPSILNTYRQCYPDVHLQLHFIDSEQAEAALLNNEYDLAVTTLPAAYKTAENEGTGNIQYHSLWQDPMRIVVSHQHPLYGKTVVHLAELLNYPAILPSTNTNTTQIIRKLFNESADKLIITMTSNHLDAIKMMVAIDLGWSVLPESLIDSSIHALPIKNAIINRQLGCIHHRHRTLSNAARAMLTCMKNN